MPHTATSPHPYQQLRRELLRRNDVDGVQRGKALAQLTDTWLGELAGAAGVTVGGVSLVAVGGYGRGELSPYSDVDLVLLHTSETPPEYAEMIAQRLWYPIWDSPVRLDHAVRSVGGARSLARTNLTELLSVLDVRHLAGDAALAAELRRRTLADWRALAPERLPALLRMCTERWDRFADLAFATTPDLKNSRGGLRDMVVMRAVAASWVADCPHQGLDEARAELLRIRDAMHVVVGRSSDRLQPQDQAAVAEHLHLDGPDALLRKVSAIGRLVGQAIDLTWHRVHRALSAPTGARRAPQRRPLADGVVEHDGEAALARAADVRDPVLPLRLAAAAAQAGIPLAPAALAKLAQSAAGLPARWPAEATREFLRLLGSGQPLVGVWEALDQAGLIGRWLPEWERLRSLPQRDPVHVYTVDRHLVQTAVEAAALVRSVARPDLLLVAALLHDVGKGTGEDHSTAGARLVPPLCQRLGFADADTGVVVRLVRHHLLLAETAVRRDPDDPATVATVAEAVGDVGVLDLLEALTQADSRAAGPGAWTSWRARQIHALAARVRAALSGWPLPRDQQPVPGAHPAVPAGTAAPSDARVTGTGAEVEVTRQGPELTVLVTAADRLGLLADVAAALAAERLTVDAVRADRAGGTAEQRWIVRSEFGDPPAPAAVAARVRASVNDPAGSRALVARRAQSGTRTDFPPALVSVVLAASATATVLEIRAHDQPGLLHRAADVIAEAGLDVSLALVDTWGAEAVDVFYLHDSSGGGLSAGRADQLAARLTAALNGSGGAGAAR